MTVPGKNVVNVRAIMKDAMKEIRANMERLGLVFPFSPLLMLLHAPETRRSLLICQDI